jgi:hypothetical protein
VAALDLDSQAEPSGIWTIPSSAALEPPEELIVRTTRAETHMDGEPVADAGGSSTHDQDPRDQTKSPSTPLPTLEIPKQIHHSISMTERNLSHDTSSFPPSSSAPVLPFCIPSDDSFSSSGDDDCDDDDDDDDDDVIKKVHTSDTHKPSPHHRHARRATLVHPNSGSTTSDAPRSIRATIVRTRSVASRLSGQATSFKTPPYSPARFIPPATANTPLDKISLDLTDSMLQHAPSRSHHLGFSYSSNFTEDWLDIARPIWEQNTANTGPTILSSGLHASAGVIAPEGTVLALHSSSGIVIATSTGEVVYTIHYLPPCHRTDMQRKCVFSPKDNYIALIAGPYAWVLEVSTGHVLYTIQHANGQYQDVALDLLKGYLVLVGIDNSTMPHTHMSTGTIDIHRFDSGERIAGDRRGWSPYVAVTCSEQKQKVVVRSSSSAVYSYDLDDIISGRPLKRQCLKAGSFELNFSQGSNIVATQFIFATAQERSINVGSLRCHVQLGEIMDHQNHHKDCLHKIKLLACPQNGSVLGIGFSNNTPGSDKIKFYDLPSLRYYFTIEVEGTLLALRISPDANQVAALFRSAATQEIVVRTTCLCRPTTELMM